MGWQKADDKCWIAHNWQFGTSAAAKPWNTHTLSRMSEFLTPSGVTHANAAKRKLSLLSAK